MSLLYLRSVVVQDSLSPKQKNIAMRVSASWSQNAFSGYKLSVLPQAALHIFPTRHSPAVQKRRPSDWRLVIDLACCWEDPDQN